MTKKDLKTMAKLTSQGVSLRVALQAILQIHLRPYTPTISGTKLMQVADSILEFLDLLESREKGKIAYDIPDYSSSPINDYSGGNASWWRDYIRAEIAKCNDYWRMKVSGDQN